MKGKNNKSEISEFLRYVRGEMTKKEEHAFQRKLQKDPFAEEATEGLEGIDPRIAEKDFKRLRIQLNKRTIKKQKVLWYSVAASVAGLMILSSIFVIVNKNKPSEQIAYSPEPVREQEIPKAPEQKKAMQIAEIEKPVPASPEMSKGVIDSVPIPEEKAVEKEELNEEIVTAVIQDAVIAEKAKEPDNLVVEARNMAAKSAVAKEINYVDKVKEDSVTVYIQPLPVNGQAGFEEYIKDNIRRPDTASAGQGEVVVLAFLVNMSGELDSIKVISSPAKVFSDEAIRLIKEGPAWKPAMENGKAIADEVRLRIVFK